MLTLTIVLPEFLASKIVNITVEDPTNYEIDNILKDLSIGEGIDFSLYSLKYDDNLLLPTTLNQFNIPTLTEALLLLQAPLIEPALEVIRRKIILDTNTRIIMSQREPEIVEAALKDPERFEILFKEKHSTTSNASSRSPAAAAATITAASSNERVSTKEDKIEENLMMAMEYHPEVFGSITMLYVNCRINENSIKAFVDCGAQTTIISKSCAVSCGLEDLIDSRFSAVAHGVGSGKILGRIHSVQLKLGHLFLPCSLTVLDDSDPGTKLPDVLLGLDMLRRYQISIDLHDNDLKINNESIVSFLPESEIPSNE